MELLMILAGVLGAVWGALTLWRGGTAAGLLLLTTAGICFGMPMAKWQLGPVPLTVDRIVFPIVVFQYLIWWRWGWTPRPPWRGADRLFVAFLAVLIFSTFSADFARDGYQPVAWLVFCYLIPAVVYFIARDTQWSGSAPRWILAYVIGLSAYLAITTVAEQRQWWPLVFPRYIAETAKESGEWIGRGRGPLLHPIGNGVLLTVGLAAVLCAWPDASPRRRMIVATVAASIVAAVAATLTRSVWLGAAGAIALMAAVVVPPRARLPLLGGGLLAAALLVGVFWEQVMNYKRERHLSATAAAESAQLRPVLAGIAWRMFCDRPLLGCGYGQYVREHLNYTDDRTTALPLEKGRGYVAHNVFLALLTETGLLGLGLFTALLVAWFRQAWRLAGDHSAPPASRSMAMVFLAAFVAYGVNGLFHDVALVAMANHTLFLAAGWMVAAEAAARRGPTICNAEDGKNYLLAKEGSEARSFGARGTADSLTNTNSPDGCFPGSDTDAQCPEEAVAASTSS